MAVRFIVNPVAGRGRGLRVWQRVMRMLEQEERPYSVAFTTCKGEAVGLAQKAADDGCSVVVAVGGDGTVHEVANGIIDRGPVLGIIPAGTGSDFIRSLPLPRDPLAAARTVYTGRRENYDAGRVNDRFFLGITGMGFDAEVCRLVNRALAWLPGRGAYVAGVLSALISFRPLPVTISVDNRKVAEEEVMLAAVANGRYFGGGMLLAPQADPSDGQLDVCWVRALSKVELLHTFPRIFSGTHVNHPAFFTARARQVTISCSLPCTIQAEGEIIGSNCLRAEVLPGKLPVMVGNS